MTRLDDHIARLKARAFSWPIPWKDVEELARSEDCRTVTYHCIAGKPTLGWGETEGVTWGMVWTLDQCDARFLQQVHRYANSVAAMCKLPPNRNQLGAMVRLAYNIGLAGLQGSTVLRQHNAGNFLAATRAFALWDKYTDPATKQKRTSAVLTARRAAEAARYATPEADTPLERAPQAVDGESSLARSPIATAGAVTTGAGVVSTLREALLDRLMREQGINGVDLTHVRDSVPAIGMTTCGVVAMLGPPDAANHTNTALSTRTQMVYRSRGIYVYTRAAPNDGNGIVETVQH